MVNSNSAAYQASVECNRPKGLLMDHALYIHLPFCRHRCAYCDFNTYAGQEDRLPGYVAALCREITFLGEHAPERVSLRSVYFGGGTPSLLVPQQFASILNAIRGVFALDDPEITLEANPGTVSLDGLRELRAMGINRISLGAQSANPGELRVLEREHDYFDVINAVKWARQGGFTNLSLDLIYGLPFQRLDDWRTTLDLVLDLRPDHISLYALTLEHGTPFGRWAARGLMPIPDPDLAAEMYELAGELLGAAGLVQYEISNWARRDFRCRHNLGYWCGSPYLAAGAGAHGYANGYRYSNVLRIKTYIARLAGQNSGDIPFPFTPATVQCHYQSSQDEMSEYMLNRLRLTEEGVSAKVFKARFERELEEQYGQQVEELIRLDLLEWYGDRLRLTPRGRLLGNQVFVRFL
jgi:oxygen-independent coproporphyrinogen-3 oxidase